MLRACHVCVWSVYNLFHQSSSLPETFLHGSSVCVKMIKMPTAACIIMKTIQSFNALISTQKKRYTLCNRIGLKKEDVDNISLLDRASCYCDWAKVFQTNFLESLEALSKVSFFSYPGPLRSQSWSDILVSVSGSCSVWRGEGENRRGPASIMWSVLSSLSAQAQVARIYK